MVPIALNAHCKFNNEEFIKHILKLCQEHKEQNRALAFVFLVYDFDDHTINKILNDRAYWSSLDKLSGKRLSIFYINSRDYYFRKRQNEIRRQMISNNERVISYMTPISLNLDDTPLEKTIAYLKEEFVLSGDINHPFLLFFQSDGQEIIDYFIINLKKEKTEEAFLELKRYLKIAVDAISNVKPEYYHNHNEIFSLIKNDVSNTSYLKIINKMVDKKISIASLISLIAKIISQ